jgi:hypothetical protein
MRVMQQNVAWHVLMRATRRAKGGEQRLENDVQIATWDV